MSSKLDMALGDILKSNRPKSKKGGGRGGGRKNTRGGGGRRGRGSGGRGGYGGSRQGRSSYRQSPYKKQGSQRNQRSNTPSHQSDSAQISISNLHVQVTEADVREIFSGIGRIKKVAVHYDARGRSRGTAVLTFQTRGQAIKAVNEYHQAEVDGRPMYVKTVGGGGGGGAAARKRSVKKKPQQQRRQQSNKKRGNNNTRGRGKKTGRGGRGGGRKRESAPSKTAEQLDKEMEDYHNNVNSGADASSAGQPSTARLFDGQPPADGAEE